MAESKLARMFRAAEELGCLACPVCGEALGRRENGFACARGHQFDAGRRGCVNFLTTPISSCYDAALFQARRRVFAAGCYGPVADALAAMLPQTPQRLLDAGCGDGWYLHALLAPHPRWRGAGLDISRDAIARATDWPETALWCVGDLRRLPFRDGAFTAVLDVLTPASYSDFRRVLAPGGLLLKVYPGEGYLRELRAARGLPAYAEGEVGAYLRARTRVLREERVVSVCRTDAALWRDFVWMTPLNQDLSAAEKDSLASRPAGQVTVDLHVAVCALPA